jgi:hypothetical protein
MKTQIDLNSAEGQSFIKDMAACFLSGCNQDAQYRYNAKSWAALPAATKAAVWSHNRSQWRDNQYASESFDDAFPNAKRIADAKLLKAILDYAQEVK